MKYSRGQLPHHRRQTKQEQYRDQNRPYVQPVLRHNFSVHQLIRLPDAAILSKPGATGHISQCQTVFASFRIKSEDFDPKAVSQRRRAGKRSGGAGGRIIRDTAPRSGLDRSENAKPGLILRAASQRNVTVGALTLASPPTWPDSPFSTTLSAIPTGFSMRSRTQENSRAGGSNPLK